MQVFPHKSPSTSAKTNLHLHSSSPNLVAPMSQKVAPPIHSLSTLNVMPTSNVVVSLVPDSQCKVNDNQLTFTTASWNTPKSVTVSAVDDLADEANIHNCFISVTTLDAYTANEYDNVSASFQVEVDDNDDTAPGFTFSPSSLAINEGEKDTFNVKLNSLPTKNVLVRAYSNQPWVCSVTPQRIHPHPRQFHHR